MNNAAEHTVLGGVFFQSLCVSASTPVGEEQREIRCINDPVEIKVALACTLRWAIAPTSKQRRKVFRAHDAVCIDVSDNIAGRIHLIDRKRSADFIGKEKEWLIRRRIECGNKLNALWPEVA